ncbi:MAG: class 1 isoprenoid biosynthesis enzyme, partial [Desulfobacterales bacterium]
MDPPDGYFSLEKNFFSALFLYSYHRAGIARSRRIIYAALNQCLRGMVTGCDNILDDEYKKTLETDLPEQGVRFRSVVDIMVSDRVLFEILLREFKNNGLSYSKVLKANAASLHALIRSGAQEASEENGIYNILTPQQVLASVHHFKTGLLFQCPWAIPRVIEGCGKEEVNFILEALYQIGMGCQIMDDMVDLASDLKRQRHNYVASVIYHELDSNRCTVSFSIRSIHH